MMARKLRSQRSKAARWLRRNALSLMIGAIIGTAAGTCHYISVMTYEAERKELLAEQVKADKAYEAEAAAAKAAEAETGTGTVAASGDDGGGLHADPDIPIDVQRAAQQAEEIYGISAEFLEAIAYYESRYDTAAVSPSGDCIGVMQVSITWHTDRAAALGYEIEDLYEAEANIEVAADYLSELFSTRPDAPYYVLMVYNGDSDAEAFLAGEAEASDYAVNVMELYEELLEKHAKGGDAAMSDDKESP